jgi:myo-inositol-1(or 4)-monophosphatase
MDKLQIMETIARKAGSYLLGAGSEERGSTDKSNTKDFVTVADIKSQDLIRRELQGAFPGAIVLSEEDSEDDRKQLYEPDFSGFILDPIDGTYNFKRDMRESSISIGYIEHGESVAGVVFDPYRDELFAAETGKGATRNGQPIHVSDQSDLANASVAITNSYDEAAMGRNLKRQLSIYEQTGSMPWFSCPGSGVLVHVWVACGRVDAYHHNGIKPWDNAAAFCILQEAGATILNLQGEPTAFATHQILVGTPKIVEQLRACFAEVPELQH